LDGYSAVNAALVPYRQQRSPPVASSSGLPEPGRFCKHSAPGQQPGRHTAMRLVIRRPQRSNAPRRGSSTEALLLLPATRADQAICVYPGEGGQAATVTEPNDLRPKIGGLQHRGDRWPSRCPDRGVYLVSGELDLGSAEQFRHSMEPALDAAGEVVIDLAEVTFIDSFGLRSIALLARMVGQRGVVLRYPQDPVFARPGADRSRGVPGIRIARW
jgi:ABC-type transporter Mla MlaB component